jgi:hypothetical protein
MAFATSTILGIVGAATAVVGTAQGMAARKEAKEAASQSAAQQQAIQNEQRAAAAEQAATERRQQIREERVRRARVVQAAENSGSAESSGEIGALGALSTNLSTNLGFNASAVSRGQRVSGHSQAAANFDFQRQSALGEAGNWDSLAGLGMKAFQGAGGFSIFSTPTGTTKQA